jgi:NADH:ubiquinone oxidoreductase subunit 4 (subunit M)
VLLQTGILGTFLALDHVLLLYLWELMLIPLYFLIGMWGSGNRVYATLKVRSLHTHRFGLIAAGDPLVYFPRPHGGTGDVLLRDSAL